MTVLNGDILKTVMNVTLADGTKAQNVWYHECRFAAPQADLSIQNAFDIWIEDVYDHLSAQLLATMTQTLCTIDKVEFDSVTDKWEVTANVGSFLPGTTFSNASEGLPNQTSAFVTFNTDRPKSRGRKFLFPFGENTQAATIITAPSIAQLVDFADEALSAIVLGPGNTLVMGIVRYGVDQFLEAFVGVVTNVLGSQRRRRPGVGA